ncbi:PREDICTED: uncharacterized protein LOC109580708 [Amphimedon queenslandica]|uniref:Uncharacterized protein n=1 Tax=Amphimedon queenslandica TaxID=400682 RepID=A0A1X7VCJ4_AMPQE|nr:PREDICTED: uncharacterized protein LOC109580708 [Amphimedon queenslandica]|eukprot:XP_019849743.1 PREDICTED: uncharacterized protein LOC109580708 [Amphimedon queenslandica]
MELSLFLLVSAAIVLVSQGQPPPPHPPPIISETFSSGFRTKEPESSSDEEFYYTGEIKTNFEEQKYFSLITTVFEDMPKRHEWRLELYERKETYIFEWEGNSTKPSGICKKQSNSGVMSPRFSWTKNATYSETKMYGDRKVDIFTGWFNTTKDNIGVDQEKKNIPFFATMHFDSEFYITYYYHDFDPTPPPSNTFTIPEECQRKF